MAITIDAAFVEQFQNNTIHLAQQSDAKLRPYIVEKPLVAALHHLGTGRNAGGSSRRGSLQGWCGIARAGSRDRHDRGHLAGDAAGRGRRLPLGFLLKLSCEVSLQVGRHLGAGSPVIKKEAQLAQPQDVPGL